MPTTPPLDPISDGHAEDSRDATPAGPLAADTDRESALQRDLVRAEATIARLVALVDDPKTPPAQLHALIGAEYKARYHRRQLLARPGADNPVKTEIPPSDATLSRRGRAQADALRASGNGVGAESS